MAKAERLVLPASVPSNEPLGRLSLNQAAVALVAMLNGAGQIPPVAQMRSMVRRGLRSRRNATEGGRHHG